MSASRAGILLAFAVAAAIRLYGLNEATLSQWDEGPYAGWGLGDGPWDRGDPRIVYAPPLYPWLCAAGYRLLEPDVRVAIGVSAAIGSATVFPVAALAGAMAGPAAAVSAAWLIALEPLHAAHSRLALTEATFTFLCLVALLLAARLLESRRRLDAVGLGAASGLAALTKFHGVLPLLSTALVALREPGRTTRDPRSDLLRKIVLAFACAAPFLVPIAVEIHREVGFRAFVESRRTWTEGFHPYAFRAAFEFLFDVTRYLSSPGLVVLSTVGFLIAWRRRTESGDLCLASCLLLSVAIVAYRDYARLAVPLFAAMVPLAARGVLAAASILARLVPRVGRRAWVALLVAAATGSGIAPLRDAITAEPSGYPEMAGRLERRLAEGGVAIAVCQQALFPYLSQAARRRVFSITEAEARRRLEAGDYRFLVVDQDPLRHARAAPFLQPGLPGFVLLERVPNPLPRVVRFDRLPRARFLESLRSGPDPDDPEFSIRLLEARR